MKIEDYYSTRTTMIYVVHCVPKRMSSTGLTLNTPLSGVSLFHAPHVCTLLFVTDVTPWVREIRSPGAVPPRGAAGLSFTTHDQPQLGWWWYPFRPIGLQQHTSGPFTPSTGTPSSHPALMRKGSAPIWPCSGALPLRISGLAARAESI